MSIEKTKEIMEAYWAGDMERVSADAVYTLMESGEQAVGRTAVAEMIEAFYNGTFDARAVSTNTIFAPQHAVLEANLVGKHSGEHRGLGASGKEVHVPMTIIYDLKDDEIVAARIYFLTETLRDQLK